MWKPLTTTDQINQEDRIRLDILDGNSSHETIFHVDRIGEFFFFAEAVSQNGQELPEDNRVIIPYSLGKIDAYGLEIWEEE